METSHRHLLQPEAGTWLNIDGFHMGVGGDDSRAPPFQRNISSAPGATTTR